MIFVFWEQKRGDGGFVWCFFFPLFCFFRTKDSPNNMSKFTTVVMRVKWNDKVKETLRRITVWVCMSGLQCHADKKLALYRCVIVTFWTPVLVWGSLIRTGWWTAVYYVRTTACECVCIPAHINLWLCSMPVGTVSRVSQPGESAGLALVMLTEGRHFRGSRTPWHQSPQSPQTDWEHLGSVSASGPRRLRSIWRGKECIGSGRGKIWARFLSLVQNSCFAS